MRYFEAVTDKSFLFNEFKNEDLEKTLIELSKEVDSAVYWNLNIRMNNYDLSEKYLELDTTDCTLDSQLFNDNQIDALQSLMAVLEELNIKKCNGIIPENDYNRLLFIIPGYFKVNQN